MDDEPISPLPEKFEDFEARMKEEKPKRRSTPVKKTVDMQAPKKAGTKTIGGMEEKLWSGVPMWRCPRCHSTTFDAATARVHTCKEVRFADETD